VANYFFETKWNNKIDFNVTYYEMYTESYIPASSAAVASMLLVVGYMMVRIGMIVILRLHYQSNE
jgi:hypothetical protein